MTKESKIYVVGDDIISVELIKKLRQQGYKNILTTNYNPYDKQQTKDFFIRHKPEIIVLDPSKDTDDKLQNRYIFSGSLNQVKRIFKFNNFFHPKEYDKLITNINYDEFYIDTYNEDIPIMELIREMHEAKIGGNMFVEFEGGLQKVNILFINDLIDAIYFIMNAENKGRTIDINNCCKMNMREVAFVVKDIIGFEGQIRFYDIDECEKKSMLDINDLGWKSNYSFDSMIRRIYGRLVDKHKYFMVSELF